MEEATPAAIAGLCERVMALKLLPRTGWLQRGVTVAESVAEHCYGVALLALVIGDAMPGIDRGRLLAIALLHDAAEALLGDLPAAARRHFGAEAKHEAERGALAEILASLGGRDQYLALWEEYAAGTSPEARLVKELDRLEMLAQAMAYERAGNRALAEFWRGVDEGWNAEFPLVREIALFLHGQRPR
jgi:putative hydrolase of HD superfamily